MQRRELLKMITILTGATLIGGELLLSGCATDEKPKGAALLSLDDISFLDEVAETILPKTDTPGAKEAAVGNYMNIMVTDCYTANDQKVFLAGLKTLNEEFKKEYQTDFVQGTSQQRTEFLNSLDKTAKEYQQNKSGEDPNHYFTMMKQLTLSGFFTSEVGATKVLRHVAIPGSYDGAYPYKKGDKAWA